MKKLAIIITAALLALTITAAALANDTTAANLYDSAVKLLFYTNNVTMNVTAEFSLDGAWFKTAEATLKQDYNRSFHQLLLRSPRADGTERNNGYTIVLDGEQLYLMEVFTPGVYRSGITGERDSLFRKSAESGLMLQLGYALAGQADLLLGSGAVTQGEDGSYILKMGNDAPQLVNAALGQFFRFVSERYFDLDYDAINANNYMSIYHFATTTEGLLYTIRDVSVRETEITVKTDADGMMQHAEGTVGLYVGTVADGVHQLDITFRADVSELGSTRVKAFDPKDYNVVPAYDGETIIPDEGMEYSEDMPPENGALIDEIELKAMKVWQDTGFDMVTTTSVGCILHENCYEVYLDGGDNVTKKAFFTPDGQLTSIQAEPNGWQNKNIDEYNYDPKPEKEKDQAAKAFLMDFLEKTNPELLETVKDLKMEWSYETDEGVYAQYHEDPLDQENDGVLFVIRISPDIRIEYYSCVSNG